MDLSKFNNFYKSASHAKNSGDMETASKHYKLAGLELMKLALNADEEIKGVMMERAEEVIAYAGSLSVEEIVTAEEKEEKIKKLEASKSAGISFEDIAGLEEVKEVIRKKIIYPREHTDIYKKFKVETGGGVLLYGPPGTGKTMIAKAIANEVDAKFFPVKSSDLLSKWYGEAEKNISALFEEVRKEKTAVIFFDEFDSLASKRKENSDVMSRVVNELLSQIDGFGKSDTSLLLLAATNRPWDIDSAMVRSKRFSIKLYIPLPDFEARKYILKKGFEGVPIDEEIDFDKLATETEGFNGADVSEFCNRSKDFVLERCIKAKREDRSIDEEKITKEDVEVTLEDFESSVDMEDIKRLEAFKKGEK